MRSALILLASVLVACSGAQGPTGPSPSVTAAIGVQEQADIYAAIIGDRGENFGKQYISPDICTDAASPTQHLDCEPMSDELKSALTARLPGARVVQDPGALMDRIFEGGGATLHLFGPVVGTGNEVKVGYSYYCGGLCGSGGTQVVELVDGEWTATGSEGPTWIS